MNYMELKMQASLDSFYLLPRSLPERAKEVQQNTTARGIKCTAHGSRGPAEAKVSYESQLERCQAVSSPCCLLMVPPKCEKLSSMPALPGLLSSEAPSLSGGGESVKVATLRWQRR